MPKWGEIKPELDFQVENQSRAAYFGSTALHLRGGVQVVKFLCMCGGYPGQCLEGFCG